MCLAVTGTLSIFSQKVSKSGVGPKAVLLEVPFGVVGVGEQRLIRQSFHEEPWLSLCHDFSASPPPKKLKQQPPRSTGIAPKKRLLPFPASVFEGSGNVLPVMPLAEWHANRKMPHNLTEFSANGFRSPGK